MAPRDRPSWGRPRTLAVAAVLSAAALTAAASAAAQSPPGEPAQIGPTVYVGGVQDLRPGWGGAPSKCDRLVDAALGYGGAFSQAQFLVSTLWWDAGPLDPPPAWAGCQNYTLGSERGAGEERWNSCRGRPLRLANRPGATAAATAASPSFPRPPRRSLLLLLPLQFHRAELLQLPAGPPDQDR